MSSPCQCGYVSLSPDADGSAMCGGCGRPIGGGLAPDLGPATDTVQFVPAELSLDPAAFAPTLDPPAFQLQPADAPPRPRKRSATPPPDVPGYDLLGELGRGGMGVVYKAREKALGRVVALKMILAGAHASESERARFRQEAAAVAALHHPGIVQIFHVGEHAAQPYLVLEYVDGGTLAERLSGGNLLSARDAAAVVAQLAATMQYAHEMGVIHRDLKPANILISSTDRGAKNGDSDSRPGSGSSPSAIRASNPSLFKISDFGLAKKIDDTVAAGGGTRTGAVMGTPSYISPEQAAGQAAGVTARSDVYSLGAILYEMLTDRPPFKADTPLETVLQVLNDEPVPPSKLRPKLAKDLETICLKCLQKDPARRYATAGELADDLMRFLAGEPIRARPVGALARGLKWVRRHPALAAFAATALAALAAVVAVLLNANATLTDANRQKEDEARTAREQTALATAAKEEADKLARERQTALNELAVEAERNRRSQYALELTTAAGTLDRDSVAALKRLNDTTRCPTDLRDYYWRYLRTLCARAEKVHPHSQPVRTVSVSPDGLLVATGDASGGVRVWNPHTNVVYAWLVGGAQFGPNRPAGVSAVAFSPDGRAVVAATSDGWVRVWKLDAEFLEAVKATATMMTDAQTELNRMLPYGLMSRAVTPTGAFQAFSHAARSLAFSPCGRWLAVAGADRVPTKPGDPPKFTDLARVWDAGAVLRQADPSRTAVLGGLGGLGEWATAKPGPLKSVREVKEHIGPVLALVFSPDGKTLATGGDDHGVILTPMGSKRSEQLALGGGPVSAVAFSPDGKTLAAVDNDETPVVVLWDVTAGKRPTQKRKLVGHTDTIRSLAFAPDGRTLATAAADLTVRVWETDTGLEAGRLNGHTAVVNAVAWLPDGRTLLSGGDDGTARVWATTLKTCDSVSLLPADEVKGKLLAAALSADGRTLATADGRQAVRLWAVDKLFNGRAAELPVKLSNGLTENAPDWGLMGLAVSDDGQRIAAATTDGGRVWDRTAALGLPGKGGATAPGRTLLVGKAVYTVRFSPTGDELYALTAAGLRVFDPATGTDLTPLLWEGVEPAGTELALSPNGRTVACVARRGTQPGVAFADADGVRFAPTDEPPTSLDFSPDGTRLLTAFATRPARVWAYDPAVGTLAGMVCDTDDPLPVVRYCREGKTLFGIRANRELVLFDAETGVERGKLDGHADRIVGLGLTPKDGALVSVGRDGVAKRWNADPPKADPPRAEPGRPNRRPTQGPGPFRLPPPPG